MHIVPFYISLKSAFLKKASEELLKFCGGITAIGLEFVYPSNFFFHFPTSMIGKKPRFFHFGFWKIHIVHLFGIPWFCILSLIAFIQERYLEQLFFSILVAHGIPVQTETPTLKSKPKQSTLKTSLTLCFVLGFW